MNRIDVVRAIALAYSQRKVLRIRYPTVYKGYLEMTDRDLEVYAFGPDYIGAFCRLRGQVRMFRVDHVLEIALLDERYEWKPEIAEAVRLHG